MTGYGENNAVMPNIVEAPAINFRNLGLGIEHLCEGRDAFTFMRGRDGEKTWGDVYLELRYFYEIV